MSSNDHVQLSEVPIFKEGIHSLVFLRLGDSTIPIDLPGIQIFHTTDYQQVSALLERANTPHPVLLISLSRNLMKNYLALSSILFRPLLYSGHLVPVISSTERIPDYKTFLFGLKPEPVSRLDVKTLLFLVKQTRSEARNFHRLPVEFVAFVSPTNRSDENIPVVCRNISWSGTFFESRRELDFEKFEMVLRSRLHKIRLPAKIIRRIRIEIPPVRFGYGVRFLSPLPLTLVQYMFLKYLKDNPDVSAS